jgi:hypothetical protein
MRTRVALLFALALIPFAIQVRFPLQESYSLIPGGGPAFYVLTGLTWCSLVAYTYSRATAAQRKRLLWLLPLVLFATGSAYLVWLALGIGVQSFRGGAMP